jgi:formylmethanofuran dehydrogenase subunit E
MGLAGLNAVGLTAPVTTQTALVIIETGGCFADGIKAATGATVGHRTLRVEDLGKIAATFTSIHSGTSIRLAPMPDVRTRAMDYAPEEKRKYFAQLQGYQVMPEDELFSFIKVQLTTPAAQIISHQNARAVCQNCGEEIINNRQVVVYGKVLCQMCAFGGYYREL